MARKDVPPLRDLPEVLPWGAPGFVIYEPDGSLDYEASMDAAYEYQTAAIEEGIQNQAEERARAYLSRHGDAVWDRVDPLLIEASALLPAHPGASLTVVITAAELIIRFLLLRPLVGGLVFNDALAERLARDAANGRSARDREILPIVNAAWDLGLERLLLEDGTRAWPLLLDLWRLRDGYVHRGEPVAEASARQAIRCVDQLVVGIVGPLATRLGLAWPAGPWLQDFDNPLDPVQPAGR
jgi:hypothetical protein